MIETRTFMTARRGMLSVFVMLSIVGTGLFLLMPSGVLAQDAAEEEENLADPGILPTSSLYVFDRLGKWAQLNLFTFNPVRKAEVRTKIAEERLSELRVLSNEENVSVSVIAQAERRVRELTDRVAQNITDLDGRGQNIAAVTERFGELAVKQQSVLDRVLDRVPEAARLSIENAVTASEGGLAKAREVILRQKEKGFIDEKRVSDFYKDNLKRLGEQIEQREKRIEKITDETLRERMKEQLERRIESLEEHALDIDTKPELRSARDTLKAQGEKALQQAKAVRLQSELRNDVREQLIEKIKNSDDANIAEEVKESFARVSKQLAELEERITHMREDGEEVAQNIFGLIQNAKKHLEKAGEFISQEEYRQAFGNIIAAERNAKAALAFLTRRAERTTGDTSSTESGDANMVAEDKEAERVTPPLSESKERNQEGREGTVLNRIRKEIKESSDELPVRERLRPILQPKRVDEPKEVPTAAPDASVRAVETEPINARQFLVVENVNGQFLPETLKVSAGATVTWVNRSTNRTVWPASAAHPTHTIYPGSDIRKCDTDERARIFDACRGLEEGQSFGFTFKEAGTWRYHDHLHPGSTGTIVVR